MNVFGFISVSPFAALRDGRHGQREARHHSTRPPLFRPEVRTAAVVAAVWTAKAKRPDMLVARVGAA